MWRIELNSTMAALVLVSTALAQAPPAGESRPAKTNEATQAPVPRNVPPDTDSAVPDSTKAPLPAGAIKVPEFTPAEIAALEKEFQEIMTGATLTGYWQMTGEGGLTGKAPLTEPKGEKYSISGVTKMGGDYWLVAARIQIAEDKDVTVPVPVRVVWSGDTPVITLDDVPIHGLGTYSARVMVYRGFYSGTWLCNGKNYGGVMMGRIEKSE